MESNQQLWISNPWNKSAHTFIGQLIIFPNKIYGPNTLKSIKELFWKQSDPVVLINETIILVQHHEL